MRSPHSGRGYGKIGAEGLKRGLGIGEPRLGGEIIVGPTDAFICVKVTSKRRVTACS
jgi:hypothetical protein